jgi:hypothetical protein
VTAVSDVQPPTQGPSKGAASVGGQLPTPERVVLDEGTTLAMRREAMALVVEVTGLADGSWADSLALELLAVGPDTKMVIDISQATLVNPASLCEVIEELIAAGSDPHRICLVCERLSAVVLLRRYGATEQVAVFGSTSDALQAAVLEAEGFGAGWAPTDLH